MHVSTCKHAQRRHTSRTFNTTAHHAMIPLHAMLLTSPHKDRSLGASILMSSECGCDGDGEPDCGERACDVICSGVWGVVPMMHMIIHLGEVHFIFWYMLVMGACYLLGALIYLVSRKACCTCVMRRAKSAPLRHVHCMCVPVYVHVCVCVVDPCPHHTLHRFKSPNVGSPADSIISSTHINSGTSWCLLLSSYIISV